MMDMREKMLLNIGIYLATYEGEDMKRIAPILNLGEKEHTLVVHDMHFLLDRWKTWNMGQIR